MVTAITPRQIEKATGFFVPVLHTKVRFQHTTQQVQESPARSGRCTGEHDSESLHAAASWCSHRLMLYPASPNPSTSLSLFCHKAQQPVKHWCDGHRKRKPAASKQRKRRAGVAADASTQLCSDNQPDHGRHASYMTQPSVIVMGWGAWSCHDTWACPCRCPTMRSTLCHFVHILHHCHAAAHLRGRTKFCSVHRPA